jgi:threonine synthase
VTLATVQKLLTTGQASRDAETVLLNTGDGLKTLDAVADVVGPTAIIPPSTTAVRDVMQR